MDQKKIKKSKLKLIITLLVSLVIAFFVVGFLATNSSKKETKATSVTYTEIDSSFLNYTTYQKGSEVEYSDSVFATNSSLLSSYDDGDTYVIIDGFTGNGWYDENASLNYCLNIPDTIGGSPVVGIATGGTYNAGGSTSKMSKWAAYEGVSAIGKVIVPTSVEYIQYGSFNGLENLAEIELPFVGCYRGLYDNKQDSYYNYFLSIFGDSGWAQMSEKSFTSLSSTAPYYNTSVTGTGVVPWYDASNTTTFYNCPAYLTNITITDEYCLDKHALWHLIPATNISVTFNSTTTYAYAYTIGAYAFANCYNATSITIPSQTTSIGEGVCNSCYSLTSIEFPEAITVIPKVSFAYCISLTEIALPQATAAIEDHAFDQCENLTTIYPSNQTKIENQYYFSNALKTIGVSAFRDNKAVETIIVPSSVTRIENYAFNGCEGLNNLTLPFIGSRAGNSNSDEALFGWIFGSYNTSSTSEDTTQNSTICVAQAYNSSSTSEDLYYIPTALNNVTITNESYINYGAFMNCKMIKSLEIDSEADSGTLDSNLTIGTCVLEGCTGLEDLNIPFVGPSDAYNSTTKTHLGWIFGTNSFTDSVPIYAYSGTTYYIPSALTTVKLNHQTTLWQYSFYKVYNVETVIVSECTQAAEPYVFAYNTSMTSLTLPFVGSARGKQYVSYIYTSWYQQEAAIKNSVAYVFGKESYTGTTYYDGVISPYYYTDASGNTRTSYYWYNYDYGRFMPNNLTSIEITDETYLTSYAFKHCLYLETIKISDTVSHIESAAFKDCIRLNYLEVPFIGANINSSSQNNSNYCLGYFFGTKTDKNAYMYKANQFSTDYYIPRTLSQIQFGSDQTMLVNWAFANCTSLTSISSDAVISSLGSYCFYNDVSLTNLTLPYATYKSIPTYGFYNCYSLGDYNSFGSSYITKVYDYGLANTSILSLDGTGEMDLSNLTYIGNYAFYNCKQITTLDFGTASLTYLGSHAFAGCSHLVDVSLTTYLTPYMFANCTALKSIYLTYCLQNLTLVQGTSYVGSSPIIPEGLFYGCINLKGQYSSNNTTYGLQISATTSGIVSIGAYAFYNCRALDKFTIPTTVTSIYGAAFHGCSSLEYLVIPSACTYIAAGSSTSSDLSTGVFYDCNDNFYLRVYYDSEDEWPSRWGNNWNCYYPVYSINNTSAYMYTYDYDSTLKGYVITGFNIYEAGTNESGWDFSAYPISGIITLPQSYCGVNIYGVEANAFTQNQDITSNITGFIIPKQYKYLGTDAFSLLDSSNKTYTIEIFIEQTAEEAKANCDSTPDTASISTAREVNMHYGHEELYADRAIVYYYDAWTYYNSKPIYKMKGINLELDQESYTYLLGSQIKPTIIGASINKTYVKLTSLEIEANFEITILNEVYDVASSVEYSEDNFMSSNFTYKYSNNINVGTGTIICTSSNTSLNGSQTLSFAITPYEIDLFNEAYEDFATYTDCGTYATSVFIDVLYGNTTTSDWIVNTTYNGKVVSFSTWDQQTTALHLPTGYTMTGTLVTSSANAGYYAMTIDGVMTNLMLPSDELITCGSFEWSKAPKITNKSGKDVTSNFTFNITQCVYIAKLTVEEISWDNDTTKTVDDTEMAAYYYRGSVIVPEATIYNGSVEVDGLFSYTTYYSSNTATAKDTYVPNEFVDEADYYICKITSHDSANINISSSLLELEYLIINASLEITMNATYTILETDSCFSFSDWANYTSYSDYNIVITGLASTSVITGAIETVNWIEGLYYYGNSDSNFDMVWSSTSPLKITSNSLTEINDPNTQLDETKFYDLSVDLRCYISYQNLAYTLMIASSGQGIGKTSLSSLKYVDSYTIDTTNNVATINFETDGNQYELYLVTTNTITDPTFTWTYNSTQYSNYFAYTDLGTYDLSVTATKDKFNPVTVTVTLNVLKGTYEFTNAEKEYDGEAINIWDYVSYTPIDFDESNFDVAYYTSTGTALSSAPYEVGSYYAIINTTTSSEWFNDLVNYQLDFKITKRSIYISVCDTVGDYYSKEYDGSVTFVSYDSSTDSSLNLLSGDTLTGSFATKSAAIGTYYASVSGDFIVSGSWDVYNSVLGTSQKSNYQIVYTTDYTITSRTMSYTITPYSGVFDYNYHTISVSVTTPSDGRETIYYSDVEDAFDSDLTNTNVWRTTCPQKYLPGVYTIYVTIVASTYTTVQATSTITITEYTPTAEVNNVVYVHDGYEHSNAVSSVNPTMSSVYYCQTTSLTSYVDYSEGSDIWDTTCPSFIDIGVYYVCYAVVCEGFNTGYGTFSITIVEGEDTGIQVAGYTGEYDQAYHGFNISNLTQNNIDINDLDITYSLDDGETWKKYTYSSSNYNSATGTYTMPLYKDIGTYEVIVKILYPGYEMIYTTVTIEITEISLDITVTDYSGVFDNKYHGVTFSGTNIILDNGTWYYNDGTIVVALTIRYSKYPTYDDSSATSWQEEEITYRNVGSYYVELEFSGEGLATTFVNGTITITYNSNPTISCENYEKEYDTYEVSDDEIAALVTTTSDANAMTITYYTLSNSIYSVTSNPIKPGTYYFMIMVTETENSASISYSYGEIVITKRVLDIEYTESYEFTRTIIEPVITVVTGTPDSFDIEWEIDTLNSDYSTLYNIGTYVLNLTVPSDYGDYYILPDGSDPNYSNLETITIYITKRTVYIEGTYEIEYSAGTYWVNTGTSPDDWTISNEIDGDYISATIQTSRTWVNTYHSDSVYEYDSNTGYYSNKYYGTTNDDYYGFKILNNDLYIYDQDGIVLDYYYISLEKLTVSIVYPSIEVTVTGGTYVYDGNYHDPVVTVTSDVTSYFIQYWYDSDPDTYYTNLLLRDVGTYTFHYIISASGFSNTTDNDNPVTITITQAHPIVVITSDTSKYYDGYEYDLTYTADPVEKIVSSEEPLIYYYNIEALEDAGYDISDLEDFYTASMSSSLRVYSFWNTKATKTITDAGSYYVFVYFPGTTNISETWTYEKITISKRPLYFVYDSSTPFIDSVDYSDTKYKVSMAQFYLDTSVTSLNVLDSNAGLLDGDYIKYQSDNSVYLIGYYFETISPNARDDAYGLYDGDFEFYWISNDRPSIYIYNETSGELVFNNYYPVINDINDEPAVQIKINRISLSCFYVPNELTLTYDGYNQELPQTTVSYGTVYDSNGNYTATYDEASISSIITTSDGDIYYRIFKTDSSFTFDGTQTELTEAIDAGYYVLLVTQLQGTNYYSWLGDSEYDMGDGYSYRICYLTIEAYEAKVVWSSTSDLYDADVQSVTAYITDVYGNTVSLDITYYDSDGNEISSSDLINAGSYILVADFTSTTSIDSNNYSLTNDQITYTINPKEYKVYIHSTELYTYIAWSITLDETSSYITETTSSSGWISDHSLDMTLTTTASNAGSYYRASHFDITWTILDSNSNVIDTEATSQNYLFTYDLLITLYDKTLEVEAESPLEYTYSGNSYYPIISTNYASTYINIEYCSVTLTDDKELPNSFDSTDITYVSTEPSFVDAGYYRVYYRVTLTLNNYSDSITGYQDIYINQKESYVSVGSLDKEYDGVALTLVEGTDITGQYNKYSSGTSLQLTYYIYDDTSSTSQWTEVSYALEVGKYKLVITSNADDDSSVSQNYTTLYYEVEFEITRASITATLDLEWVLYSSDSLNYAATLTDYVTEVSGDTYSINKYYAASGTASSSNYYGRLYGSAVTTGLVGSDYLKFDLTAATGLAVGEYAITIYDIYNPTESSDGTYVYTSTTTDDNNFTYLFYILYADSEAATQYDHIYNYSVDVVINFVVRYKSMTVSVDTPVTYDYTGSAYSFADSITVTAPSSYSIAYGNSKGSYTNSTATVTAPGTYQIYFKITATDYEDYEGSAIIIIKYVDRDDYLSVTATGKTYDGVEYTTTYTETPTISYTWADTTYALPTVDNWTYAYYDAASNDNGSTWYVSSSAMSSVVDAGNYILRVIIPQSDIYSQTTLDLYFMISQRNYTLEFTLTKQYDYSIYSEDIVELINSGDVTVSNLVDGHYFSAGNLETSLSYVATYTSSDVTYYITLKNYVMLDSTGRNVSVNYTRTITGTITITEGYIKVKNYNLNYNSTNDIYYLIYTGNYVTPKLYVASPTGVGATIEYSKDGSTWSSSLNYLDVGDYTFFYRVVGVDNFYDVYPGGSYNTYCFGSDCTVDFSITYNDNTITISSLDKYYDGEYVSYPTITTLDTTQIAGTTYTTFYQTTDGGTTWSALSKRPINVGKYKVVVDYPATANYNGVSGELEFEIKQTPIFVDAYTTSLVYDTTAQTLDLTFSTTYSSIDLTTLVAGTDYSLTYYQYDSSTDSYIKLSSAPSDVGTYKVAVTLLNDNVTNMIFFNTNSSVYEISYQISSAQVLISYTATVDYNNGSVITIDVSSLTISGLPSTVELSSSSTISSISGELGYYSTGGYVLYTASAFTDYFVFDTTDPVIIYTGTTVTDDINNYEVFCYIKLTITSGTMPYTVAAYNGVYDGNSHTFTFELGTTQYTEIQYSVNQSTWTTTIPTYTGVTDGTIHVYVRVISTVYGDENDNYYVYLGTDSTSSDYNEFSITITKAERTIEIDSTTDLNKVYDAQIVDALDLTINGDSGYTVHYSWFRVKTTDNTETETEVSLQEVYSVGKYRVYVYVGATNNYYQSSTVSYDFEITARRIVIRVGNQSKVYDASLWETYVSSDDSVTHGSATVEAITGYENYSGLLSGHNFYGTLQTVSANAGLYSVDPDDFTWKSEYTIYNGSNVDVTSNYKIIISAEVTISTAEFDVTGINFQGYYDGSEHSITITFNTYPIVNTTDYRSLISYSTDNSTWTQGINPTFLTGTTVVYWKVEAANYSTYISSNFVQIYALDSTAEITVHSYELNYTGTNAEIIDLITLGLQGDTRDASITYYTSDGTQLNTELYSAKNTASPIDAGSYYFIVTLEETSIYAEWVSQEISFTILPIDITVVWTADKTSDGYQMIYTGSQITPTATATGLDSNSAYNYDIPLTLTITSPESGESINVGSYSCNVVITNSADENNYNLVNNAIDYEIVTSDDVVPVPDGYELYSIVFESPSLNPLTNSNYTYGDTTFYLIATITYINTSTSQTLTYRYAFQFDAEDGIIDYVYDLENSNADAGWDVTTLPFIVNISSLDLSYDENVGYYVEAIASLNSTNYAWGSNGNSDDQTVWLLCDQATLSVDDGDNLSLYIPYDTFTYSSTTVDEYEVTVNGITYKIKWTSVDSVTYLEFTVYLTYNSTVVDSTTYDVTFTDNNMVTSAAVVTVTSNTTSNYAFTLTKTFAIESPVSQYLCIINNYDDEDKNNTETYTVNGTTYDIEKYIGFIYYDQDFTNNLLTLTEYSNESRGTLVENANASELANIMLSKIEPNARICDLMSQFIQAEGQVIVITDADGNTVASNAMDATTSASTCTSYVTTGMFVNLYDENDLANPIDYIEVCVTGDVNGDGYVNNPDITSIISFLSSQLETSYYRACLVKFAVISVPNATNTDIAVLLAYLNIQGNNDASYDDYTNTEGFSYKGLRSIISGIS